MNILHLLSQNHLTGAEVYAVTLAQQQLKQKHRVYQVSNGFYYPTEAIKFECEVETRSRLRFIQNVLWLRNFLRKQDIQVVHAHSRAAAKLAYWATLFSKTAHISTVHGVQHPSFSKKLFNQYGRFIIAVCENIKEHLITDFSYRADLIKVIPNAISGFEFAPKAAGQVKRVAVIGRLTGPKAARTEQVLKALGGTPYEVTTLGGSDVKLAAELYRSFDVVIGSGRVCMEALISGVPCIAFGESAYVGLVTPANFHEALKSNFGDMVRGSLSPNLNPSDLLSDLKKPLPDLAFLSEMAQETFSLPSIAARVQRLYESAFFLKNYSRWIPVLMYHKIPVAEISSQHKIYVTRDHFEQHLKFFKKRGFQTLTFADLAAFRRGEKSFREFPCRPLVLTFDDGYRDNLENASPLLKNYGFRAQLFLLADSSVKDNHWDAGGDEPSHEIISGAERALWKDSAFEIGSHGFSHRKITQMSAEEAFSELQDSKDSLEKEFGTDVNVYAFTYGITGPQSAEQAFKAGYDYAVNTDTGGLLLEEDPYRIFRVSIFPMESKWSLFKKTSSWYRRYYFRKRKK